MTTSVRKRVTRETDVDRLSERLLLESGDLILDRSTFDTEYNNYLATVLTDRQDNKLRREVFKRLRERKPSVSEKRLIKPRAKPLTKEQIRSKQFQRRFKESDKFLATFKDRVTGRIKRVFAIKTSVIVKGHRVTRFRDKKGRFVKVQQDNRGINDPVKQPDFPHEKVTE